MMDLLVNHVLVRGIIRIQNLDSLPPTLTLIPVSNFKSSRDDEDGDGDTLRVDTSLHQLLLAGEIRVPAHQRQRSCHCSDPRAEDDWITILSAKVLYALRDGFGLFKCCPGTLVLILIFRLGIAGPLEGTRVLVGSDDSWKMSVRNSRPGISLACSYEEGLRVSMNQKASHT